MAVRTSESDTDRGGPARVGSVESMPDGALLGQAALLPESLTSRQVLQLQRAIGNRATRRIATHARRRLRQRSKTMIPLAVRFDRPLTRDEFIRLADEQLKLEPGRGTWNNLKDHYAPEDSPVRVRVAASLVKAQRSSTTAAELGLGVDPSGAIAGAGERAAALTQAA